MRSSASRLRARLRMPVRLALWLFTWCSLDRAAIARLSWRGILDSLRRGFFPSSYALYELDRNDASLYFSDRAFTLHAQDFNGGHNACINSKVAFAYTLRVLGLRMPEVYRIVHGGRACPAHGAGPSVPAQAAIAEVLAEHRRAVLKPMLSWAGRGVAFLERRGHALLLNGSAVTAEDLAAIASTLDDNLLTEFVEQAGYSAAIFPDTTNTVRLLTLWDYAADAPFVAAAAHRFGTKRSGLLDNFHGGRGGLSVAIDRETGVMGAGRALSEAGVVERLRRHPDTGAEIAGVAIPGWSDLTAAVLAAAARLPYAPCIGWDLVVTAAGVTCLEANSPPGTFVWQVHGPLLADPRSRRFFAHFGAVPGRV